MQSHLDPITPIFSQIGSNKKALRAMPSHIGSIDTMSLLPDPVLGILGAFLAEHEAGLVPQWCRRKHWGECGQNCPCCRFRTRSNIGECWLCEQACTLMAISPRFHRVLFLNNKIWAPWTRSLVTHTDGHTPSVEDSKHAEIADPM